MTSNARSHRLSCVLPAFNEEDGIGAVVERVLRSLERHATDFEVLVVDDGSTDATAAVLARLAERSPRLRVLRLPENCGYGAALRAGFAACRMPLVLFTDSDGQFDPEEVARLLERIDGADLVVGRRVGRDDGALRAFLSAAYNHLVRRSLGVRATDVNCAFKLLRRDALEKMRLASDGYVINAEILVRAAQLGLRVREVAVTHRPRRFGRSKVSILDVPRALSGLFSLWTMATLRALPEQATPDLRDEALEAAQRP